MLGRTIQDLRAEITEIAESAALAAPPVTVLAACKGQPVSVIEAAIAEGILDFGENKVQEAQGKWPVLRQRHPHVRLHMIGPLQTNKTVAAVELFDVIQTLDRPKLAEALAKAMQESGRSVSCYIQVNTGKEPQKAGVFPEEADALIRYCRERLALPVVGIMGIPPHHQPPAPHFALLRSIALRHGLTELSMGMSEDYRVAIRMGSTCVRIGRALFAEH